MEYVSKTKKNTQLRTETHPHMQLKNLCIYTCVQNILTPRRGVAHATIKLQRALRARKNRILTAHNLTMKPVNERQKRPAILVVMTSQTACRLRNTLLQQATLLSAHLHNFNFSVTHPGCGSQPTFFFFLHIPKYDTISNL